MADFKKLNEAIELMNAIKSTFEDNPEHVNKETRKQRHEQSERVIQYLTETRYAAIKEMRKREEQEKVDAEKILLWRNRAYANGYKEVDARVSYNNQIDNLTF